METNELNVKYLYNRIKNTGLTLIDGEWQNHDYCNGDKLFWKPISEPCKGVEKNV